MSDPPDTRPLGAVVLCGGTGSRMGGVDKAAIEIDGVTLLERALTAVADATAVVVVGDPVPTSRPVTWAREVPPGGGPAAGLLAGLDRFDGAPELVCVLAVDMPRVDASTVARLVRAVGQDVDGAVLVDGSGVRQPLAAVYRGTALESARPPRPEQQPGLPVRRLVAGLRLVEVAAVGDEARDVDTWDDLRRLSGGPGNQQA